MICIFLYKNRNLGEKIKTTKKMRKEKRTAIPSGLRGTDCMRGPGKFKTLQQSFQGKSGRISMLKVEREFSQLDIRTSWRLWGFKGDPRFGRSHQNKEETQSERCWKANWLWASSTRPLQVILSGFINSIRTLSTQTRRRESEKKGFLFSNKFGLNL